jgi:hypothetical protein
MRIFKGVGTPVGKIKVANIDSKAKIPNGWHDTKAAAWGIAEKPKKRAGKKATK